MTLSNPFFIAFALLAVLGGLGLAYSSPQRQPNVAKCVLCVAVIVVPGMIIWEFGLSAFSAAGSAIAVIVMVANYLGMKHNIEDRSDRDRWSGN